MARFDSLKYPVHKADPNIPLDQQFPRLFSLPEMRRLKERGTWATIVKYIVFLYDKGTDLIAEYPSDLKARKEEAAALAGYVRDSKGQWNKEAQAIMDIKVPEVHAAILAYLKEQKYVVWTEIVVTEEELYEFQKLRFMSIDTGETRSKRKKGEEKEEFVKKEVTDKEIYEAAAKKDALMKACNERIKQLEVLYGQFYGDSKKDLMDVEFEEMIKPETAERILAQIAPKQVPATESI